MSQDQDDTPKGAFIQRDKKTFAIVPKVPGGVITPEELRRIADVADKYKVPLLKITSGQRIAMVGLEKDKVDQVWQDLGMEVGLAVGNTGHYVQVCPGDSVCKIGVQDSLAFAAELDSRYIGKDFPAKVKFGVSGCPMSCAESYVRDVGVIGTKRGWTVTFGGNSGVRPRIGDVLAKDLSRPEALELIDRALEYYRTHCSGRKRTSRFVEDIGIDKLRSDLGLE